MVNSQVLHIIRGDSKQQQSKNERLRKQNKQKIKSWKKSDIIQGTEKTWKTKSISCFLELFKKILLLIAETK